MTAYDAATGKRAWRFYTTPDDEVTPVNRMPPFSQSADKELEDLRFYPRARPRQAPGEQKAYMRRLEAAKASNAKPQDFAGKWNIVIQSPMGPPKAVMDLKVNGN